MFTGEYGYKVDDKGRLPFPPKYREELKGGFMLARGFEKCINVYPIAEWKNVADSRAIQPQAPSKDRRMNRFMFASTFDAEFDGQGRVALPAPLREHAGITNAVIIVGVNTYLEIWSKEQWEEEFSQMSDQAWEISEMMEDRG